MNERLSVYGFNEIGKPPNKTGLYAICARVEGGCEHVLYIGSSYTIRARVMCKNHWYRRAVSRFGSDVVYVRWMITNRMNPTEERVIRGSKPILNKHIRGTPRWRPPKNKKTSLTSILIEIPGEDALALSNIAKRLTKARGEKVHRTDVMREGLGLILNLHRKP